MAVTEGAAPPAAGTFTSVGPASGEVVGSFPVDGPEAVAATVARARQAAGWWAGLGFEGRRKRLSAYKGQLARRSDELCDLVHRENGKPLDDAFIEVLVTVEHLDWAARNAAKALEPRRVRSTLLLANQGASVEYLPLGVVGVVGPWNDPLH